MVKIKSKRGITLVALVLTIIVALILATITIYIGSEDIESSKMIKFVAYMQAIQKKVDIMALEGNYQSLGSSLTNDQKTTLNYIITTSNEIILTTSNSETLKYFDSSALASAFEMENINDEIVVDFATREVISLNGIEYKNKQYYTQYNLPGGQTLVADVDLDEEPSFDSITANINGLNATFTISGINITNGTLSYSTNKESWIVVTNYTIANQDVVTGIITKSGTYYFKLTNNVTGEDNGIEEGEPLTINYPSQTLRLANGPKLKENLEMTSESYNYANLDSQVDWAFAEDATNNSLEYVWIPRFAYETEDDTNIVFLRGTSDITTEDGYITTDWTVPYEFKNGDIDLTGVWVKTDSFNSTDTIIEILENGTIL